MRRVVVFPQPDGPHQGDELALRDGEGDVRDRHVGVVALTHPVDLEHRDGQRSLLNALRAARHDGLGQHDEENADGEDEGADRVDSRADLPLEHRQHRTGRVSLKPETNHAIMYSSKEIEAVISRAATMAGRAKGRTTSQRVRHGPAPRFQAAGSRSGSRSASRIRISAMAKGAPTTTCPTITREGAREPDPPLEGQHRDAEDHHRHRRRQGRESHVDPLPGEAEAIVHVRRREAEHRRDRRRGPSGEEAVAQAGADAGIREDGFVPARAEAAPGQARKRSALNENTTIDRIGANTKDQDEGRPGDQEAASAGRDGGAHDADVLAP